MRLAISFILLIGSMSAFAQTSAVKSSSTTGAVISTKTVDQNLPWLSLSRFGANYFTFWEGPNIDDGQQTTNELGRPTDDGLNFFHQISITFAVSKNLNIDLQNRLEHVHTQEEQWRFQGSRIGISGTLARGEKWSLKGAVNTDIPELNGRDARQETVIFNPGLFTGFNYQISNRWSFFSIVSPRVFFYRDDDAVTDEWLKSGRPAGQKRKFEFRASPTINYAFNDKIGMRTGLDLNFRQFVRNDWNYIRRWPTAMTVGPTFSIHRSLNLYTFIQTFPFDGDKIRKETTSLGMWISGVIF